MSKRNYSVSNPVEFLQDVASGSDDPDHVDLNPYTMNKILGAKAKITRTVTTVDKKTEKTATSHSVLWSSYSMENSTQTSRTWAEGLGLSEEDINKLVTMRLIKRIHGTGVDPTMYLTQLDQNFNMVTRRVSQALEFLRNLKNPKKLAALTLRYFKGKETRRSLTKRYRSARDRYRLRAKKWRTGNWASSYLEFQFGWRPLCEDTWKLIGLAREAKRRRDQQRVRASLDAQTVEETTTKYRGPLGRDGDFTRGSILYAGHGKIFFNITNPWLRAGASLEPPTYALWDMIPYSWLADCITNVGQHLKYALYDAGLSFSGGYTTTHRVVNAQIYVPMTTKVTGNKYYSYYTKEGISEGSITYTGVHNHRHKLYSFPAIPWFNRFFNTMKNAALLGTLAVYLHQQISLLNNKDRWLNVRL